MSAPSDIFLKVLKELPVTVLILSEEGKLLDINDIGLQWFGSILHVGHSIPEEIIDMEGKQLDLVHGNAGYLQVGPGQQIFRFLCGAFTDSSFKYTSVCIFDDTESYRRGVKDEKMTSGMTRDNTVSYSSQTSREPKSLTPFETSSCLDAGLGLGEDANACFVRYSPAHQVIECSGPMRGFSQEELIGKKDVECMHPDDVKKTLAFQASVAQDPRKVIPVYLWLRKQVKSGGYVHVEIIGAYRTTEDGQKYLSGVERVVDARKMVQLLTYITDQLPCAIMMVDRKNGCIEMVNEHAQEWMNMKHGLNFEECIESQRSIIFSPDDCDQLLKAVREAYHQVDESHYVELTVTTLQQRTLTFLCKAKIPLIPTSSADLKDDGILLWVVDITEFSKRMDAKQMAVLRFVRCISHDMRTPMQAISLASQTLKDGDGNARENIEIITSSTAILETMLSNILEFKPISTESPLPECYAVDVKSKIQSIIHILEFSTLKTTDIALSAQCDWEGTKYIWTDGTMFDRIFLNLICNALKFTKEGHVKVACSIEKAPLESASEDDDCNPDDLGYVGEEDNPLYLKIIVSDTGRGMDEFATEHLGQLDFFEGDEGGFGLGTYIVNSYIKALGGMFHVTSKLQEGSVVTVEIPVRLANEEEVANKVKSIGQSLSPPPHTSGGDISDTTCTSVGSKVKEEMVEQSVAEEPSQAGSGDTTAAKGEEDFKSYPILVVDDVDVNRKLMFKALERMGFTVDQANNGQVALDMMLKNDYRTVIMDINMPVMNGDEAIRAYWKQNTKENHPKIIVLTGNTATTDHHAAIECGAHGFLAKPVNPKQLWAAVSWQ